MSRALGSQRGFTLIEMVCVMAIIGLLAAVLMPSIPRETSPSRLQAYAIEAAALLKADRNAAIRARQEISTQVDAGTRMLRSGSTGSLLQMPEDVRFDALLPESCNNRAVFSAVSFFASGMSCGGVIALTRFDAGYEIRVNWLTGSVDVVPRGRDR
jgi:general secretion pathway protein H